MKEIFPIGADLNEGAVLNIDKPLRWTSTDVVRKIKFIIRIVP